MDVAARRQALGMIPYGLVVVGVRQGDRVSAFTGTWLSQCSFQPPRLMLGVRRDSESHPMIEAHGSFAISFLAEDQKEIAKAFFRRPEVGEGTLAGLSYELGMSGCPILRDAPAWVECRVVETVAGGDHSIIVGEVTDVGVRQETPPLLLSGTGWSYHG